MHIFLPTISNFLPGRSTGKFPTIGLLTWVNDLSASLIQINYQASVIGGDVKSFLAFTSQCVLGSGLTEAFEPA